MARRRKGRAVNGVIILDKPLEISSNLALQKVRRLFQAQKAGHTGTLDPLATGVLPICLGEATKYSSYLLDAEKGYYTTGSLGEIRDTGDSEGTVVETRPVPDITAQSLEPILEGFRGDTMQVPSMYSALKHQGRPLYEWARAGVTVDRPARPISISHLELTGLSDAEFDLSVQCSKGTYIRSLVEDIGLEVGCGAHVSMLRRFKAGCFSLDDAHSFEYLAGLAENLADLDALLMPIDILLQNFPQISVNKAKARSLLHGQAVTISAPEKNGLSRLYVPQLEGMSEHAGNHPVNEEGKVFAGMVEVSAEGEVKPARLVNFSLS